MAGPRLPAARSGRDGRAVIRVLIVDDQAIVRTGMAMILAAEDDIDVVAEAVDGVHALEEAARHRPDVVLMDIRMPRLNGLDALRALTRPTADHVPKVVMVTTFDDEEYVNTALQSGACGFVLKDSGPRLLAEAVRAAAVGDSLISPSITVRLLRRLVAPGARRSPDADLSPREVDVVRLVAQGLTNAEISHTLSITVGTVKTHLGNIQGKLAVRNRVEIAAWAWRVGLARAD
ncbi:MULTISPECIES: response regulator transcription factor [Streptomyces]|uniref:Response regulator transcription factor n=1 Tax=Streptomyces hirsutus TaxID=35620 RepID=A0ABZ1GWJ8_9ACTN|nr:response regulator transcription factor [Streptomyces hirsutus]WSD10500.1 response regulator transcription factor [Streptomyces hirsutus]WTD16152.1 response regulator transcription factor [Streptomyces hirsutus]WTD79072.1 response regulator transcription factor [Streptomyces sp. NBC_01635]